MPTKIDLSQASLATRLWCFPRRPWPEQRRALLHRIFRWAPGAVVPIRLPFGSWWLAKYEYSTDLIVNSGYEELETAFMLRALRRGTTVLDVGANRGYYTLLASQRVGPRGRVIAFEPSARERRFLKANLFLNRCRNVVVESFALGGASGAADLYVVEGYSTGCNCLRSRQAELPGYTTTVSMRTLDEYVKGQGIDHVDLLKMDIEGAELEVIRGASRFLRRRPRPIIVCELIDQLTHLWGYEPGETIAHLSELGFEWFCLSTQGSLRPLCSRQTSFDGNFVAVPQERLRQVQESGWLSDKGAGAEP